MVMMVSDPSYWTSDNFWDSEVDYHVYEKMEKATGPKPVYFIPGFENTAATQVEYKIRLRKARVLDEARKKLIKDTRQKAKNAFPDLLGTGQMSGSSHIKRSVGGVEGVPDSAIML